MPLFLTVLFAINAVEFGASRVKYESQSRQVFLEDSAWVRTQSVELYADTILYFSANQIVRAYGHCILVVEGDTMSGDSLAYNLKLDDGAMWHGRAHIEKGWITGKTIVKLGKDTILIKDGSFTTCELVPPHYSFVSRRMKLENRKLGIVQPLILEVHQLPVFYAPFWFFPLRKDRHSGFLMPSVGYNTRDGKYIRRLRYYLVLSNYADMTFGVDLIEKRGPKFDVQTVYRLYKRFNGELNFSWADDIYMHRIRWSLSGHHYHDFGKGWTLRGNGNFVSDRNFSEDYSEEHTEWLKQEMRSFISLSKRFRVASFNVTMNRTDNLADGTTRFQAPNITFRLFNKTIWKVNISFNSDFRRAGFSDSTSSSLRWAWRNRANMSAQFKILRYFNLVPAINFVSTVFDTNILGQGPFEVHGFSSSVSLSTVLYGVSLFGIGPVRRFKHTLRPYISMSYIPEFPRDSLTAPMSGFGKLPAPAKNGGFGIRNEFDARLKNGRIVNIMSLNISGYYDLDKSYHPLTPLGISVNSSPYRNLSLRGGFYIDPYTFEWSNFSFNTGVSFGFRDPMLSVEDTVSRAWNIGIFHTISKPSPEVKASQRLAVSISGSPTPNWSVR